VKRHLCGTHAVLEALSSHARDIAVVYIAGDTTRGPLAEIATKSREVRVSVEVCDVRALDALAGGVRHQGVIAVSAVDYPYIDLNALLERARQRSNTPLLVALDEVTDPHNFGAVIRSTVALGGDGVITLKDRAAPVTPVVVRASAGATEHASIARVVNLSRTLETLSREGYRSVGLDAEGSADLEAIDLTGPLVLVVGSEGNGLRRLVRERCDVLARIPLSGPVASLNASVAAAIALYEVGRQRRTIRSDE
jgi:23S rRNA (guanosine2251-2'-O)-methyltransferase